MEKKLALILSFFIFFSLFQPNLIRASGFDSAYLRLDKQTPLSPLSGTVCASPSSPGAGVENKVIVTFPSTFNISSNPSDWTTNVTNLPEGSANWPGIGTTASNVSGQSVTFTGNDLTSTSLYCFNFNANLSNTGTAGNDQTGTIITRDNSNSLIDSATYSTSIVNNNQIAVTASVDPRISDLPITIESMTTGGPFPQDTQINYKITYGSNTVGPVPLTIQAQWSQGTIGSSPAPSVDILNYVIGSASNAYGNTPPVIDTINRTITWTISSFPGATTGQTLTFSLKTNSAYTGSELVSFDISARAISGATVTPDQTITQTYLYDANLVPTPSPTETPVPTSAPSVGASPTPSPTSIPSKPAAVSSFYFSTIEMRSISKSEADIFIATNNKANLNLSYGTSINSFNQSVKTLQAETENTINISGLKPNTTYYFKVTAKDENGNSITSDIFTFKTASVSPVPNINKQSLIVTSNDNVLLNASQLILTNPNPNYTVVIPTNSVFTFQFALNKAISLKSIQAIIRDRRVLGFTTVANAQASTNFVDLIEVQPGIYTGKLSSPKKGQYEIYIRLIDYNGNVLEEKIMNLNVTNKFSVIESGTNKLIENARVFLSLYNQLTKTYYPISFQTLPLVNPTYTDPYGIIDTVLPQSKYKAVISAIGYKTQTVEFTINPYSITYPVIKLEREPFNILHVAEYYLNIINDSIITSQNYLRGIAASTRLFDLVTGTAMLIFIFIVFISFSARTHISLLSIPSFFISKLYLLFLKSRSPIIVGKVLDEETKMPVSRANVYLLDSLTQKLFAQLKTNKLGEFYFRIPKDRKFKLSVMKKNYVSSAYYEYQPSSKQPFPFEITIKRDKAEAENILRILFVYMEDLLGVLLEASLVLGLVVEAYLTSTFGFTKLIPFLIITTLTIILYMLFVYKPRIRSD